MKDWKRKLLVSTLSVFFILGMHCGAGRLGCR